MGHQSTLPPGVSPQSVRDDTFGSAPPARPFRLDGLDPLITVAPPTQEGYQQFLESLNVSSESEETHLLGRAASQIVRSSSRAIRRSLAALALAEGPSADLQGVTSNGTVETHLDGDIEHIGLNHDVQKISIKSEHCIKSATIHTFPNRDNVSPQEAHRNAVIVGDGEVGQEIDMVLTMLLDPFVRPAVPGLPPAAPLSLPVPRPRPLSALAASTLATHPEEASVAGSSVPRRATTSAGTRARKVSDSAKRASKRISGFYNNLMPVTSVTELPNVKPIYYHPPPRPASAVSRPRRIARAFRDKVKDVGKDVLARLGFEKGSK